MGIGEELYSGTATVGKITGWVYLVVGIIIGVIFIAIGVYMKVKNDDKNWVTVDAKVSGAKCTGRIKVTRNTSSYTYDCELKVDYKVSDKIFKDKNLFVSNKNTRYVPGSILKIKYKKDDPNIFKEAGLSASTWGTILIVLGVVFAFCGWLNWYLTQKSKMYAAVTGTGAMLDVVT
jgi:hypothetical protein